jgi:hypothetical protein
MTKSGAGDRLRLILLLKRMPAAVRKSSEKRPAQSGEPL